MIRGVNTRAAPGAVATEGVMRQVVSRIAVANLVGVGVVFVASTLATPARQATLQRVGTLTLVTVIYVALTVPFGSWRALQIARRDLRPLYESRAPTPAELRVMLSVSARQMTWVGAYWFGAAVVIGVTSVVLGTSALVSLRTTIAILFGGLTTCTLGWVLAERTTRPLAITALSHGVRTERPPLIGVRARLAGAWAVGSGLPLLAIALALAGGTELDRGRLVALGIVLAVYGVVAGGTTLLMTSASIADALEELRSAMQNVRSGDLETRVTRVRRSGARRRAARLQPDARRTALHYDADFDRIAAATGQPLCVGLPGGNHRLSRGRLMPASRQGQPITQAPRSCVPTRVHPQVEPRIGRGELDHWTSMRRRAEGGSPSATRRPLSMFLVPSSRRTRPLTRWPMLSAWRPIRLTIPSVRRRSEFFAIHGSGDAWRTSSVDWQRVTSGPYRMKRSVAGFGWTRTTSQPVSEACVGGGGARRLGARFRVVMASGGGRRVGDGVDGGAALVFGPADT